MNLQMLLAAAGFGSRLGRGPKSLVPLSGRPLFVRTLERLARVIAPDHTVILHPPGFREAFEEAAAAAFPGVPVILCEGGAERQDSIRNGLEKLDRRTDVVLIHDAARPFVRLDSIGQSIEAAVAFGAATVAIPVTDTILHADDAGFLLDTPDRRALWACQTPQTFRVDVIRRAHEFARREYLTATDDATLVRRMGGRVKLVMGTPWNLKITTPEDLILAEHLFSERLA